MGMQRKPERENINKLDFIKPELDYIVENANFTEEQEKIFKMLTGKDGRKTIVNISLTLNMSESTVKRRIRQIKNKIIRIL